MFLLFPVIKCWLTSIGDSPRFPKWCDTVFCHPEHYFIPTPTFSSTKYRDNYGGHWSWLYSWELPKRPIGNAYEKPLGEGSDTPKEHLSLTCLLIATIHYSFQTNLLLVNIMFFGIHVYHFIPIAYTLYSLSKDLLNFESS